MKSMKKAKAKRYVPDQILMQILLFLPCKSLVRSTIVCKQWHACINDPQFLNDYRRRAATHPSSFLIWTGSSSSYRRFHLYSIGRYSYAHTQTIRTVVPTFYQHMLPSSYGLVCLHGRYQDRSIAVFNPTTEDFINLPDIPKTFDAYTLGFGFDPRMNKYKVVQLVHDPSSVNVKRCNVLTVGRAGSSWRAVDASLNNDQLTQSFFRVGLCAGGVLYWEIIPDIKKIISIIMFDLHGETIKVISSPDRFRLGVGRDLDHLVEMQGNLCFVDTDSSCGSLVMDISMLDVDNSWTHLYRLELGMFPDIIRSARDTFFPLCIKDGRILLKNHKALYSYHLKEKSLELYEGNGDETLTHWLLLGYATVHAETLVLLD